MRQRARKSVAQRGCTPSKKSDGRRERPDRQLVLDLQRTAGNAAVTSLLTRSAVQRVDETNLPLYYSVISGARSEPDAAATDTTGGIGDADLEGIGDLFPDFQVEAKADELRKEERDAVKNRPRQDLSVDDPFQKSLAGALERKQVAFPVGSAEPVKDRVREIKFAARAEQLRKAEGDAVSGQAPTKLAGDDPRKAAISQALLFKNATKALGAEQTELDLIKESNKPHIAALKQLAKNGASLGPKVTGAIAEGGELEFDKVQLIALKEDAGKAFRVVTKKVRILPEDVERVKALFNAFAKRYEESKSLIGTITMKPGDIADAIIKEDKLRINNNMFRIWSDFLNKASQPTRNVGALGSSLSSFQSEIDRKTPMNEDELAKKLVGLKAGKKATVAFATLKSLAGGNPYTVRRCMAHETDVAVLDKLLKNIDSLEWAPTLLAKTTDHTMLADLLAKCGKKSGVADAVLGAEPDEAVLKKVLANVVSGSRLSSLLGRVKDRARLAGMLAACEGSTLSLARLLDLTADNSVKLAFWLVGEGGQEASVLAAHLPTAGKIWAGGTGPEPAYQPLGTDFAHIKAVAVHPCPRGGYHGNEPWTNDARPGSQILPRKQVGGAAITYQEFDTKKRPMVGTRDAQRVVEGSDGRRYYTADHYNTFYRIV